MVGNAALGSIPGWLVILVVALLYAGIAAILLSHRHRADDDEVHV
jgi:uncharacterized membrane protein